MWKDKTCEKCMYRDGERCRKFPPQDNRKFINAPAFFPRISFFNNTMDYGKENMNTEMYSQACSYYEETK